MQSPPAQSETHKATGTTSTNDINKAKNANFKSVIKHVEDKGEQKVNHNNQAQVYSDSEQAVEIKNSESIGFTELVDEVDELSDLAISIEMLEGLIEELSLPVAGEKLNDEELTSTDGTSFLELVTNESIVNDEVKVDEQLHDEVLAQLQIVLQQLSLLMNKGESSEELHDITKEVHKLLQLWGRLSQQMQDKLKEQELMLENVDEEHGVLRDLINLFEKRNAFAKHQMYQTNSSITQDDVQKWLQQSLEKYSFIDEERTYTSPMTNQALQMSSTQQYTLHVSESERIDAISRNLVSDLSNIVSRSNFLKQPGLEELTLTLRPHSLGDVTIRLAQVNGEMTVRFLVTTQAARELFESNLHQLKPMFAPNNVVIERDSGVSDEEFYQEEQEQLEEEQQKDQEQQGSHDETSQADVSFDELLQFISKEANV